MYNSYLKEVDANKNCYNKWQTTFFYKIVKFYKIKNDEVKHLRIFYKLQTESFIWYSTTRWTIELTRNKKICFNPWKKSVNEKKKLNNSKTDIWVLFVKFIIINWNLNKLGKNFHFFITTWKNKNGFLIVHCWTLMKQQT